MKQKFTLTEDHIKLLRRAYISWEDCEYGAPAIDCKRPYGNSDVETDIADILGWQLSNEEMEDGLSRSNSEKAEKLHQETQTALQIILSTKSFKVGNYENEGYGNNWKLIK